MKHERRTIYLAKQFEHVDTKQKHFEPVRLELNRDASAILVMTTLGLFIMSAALLLNLFIGLGFEP